MKSCVLVVLSLLASSPCMAQYSFTTVDYPGAAITRLIGVNDHGEMVGHYILPGQGQVRHAFKYLARQVRGAGPGRHSGDARERGQPNQQSGGHHRLVRRR